MDLTLATKYSFITNKLRYCGPHDAYLRFLDYVKSKDEHLEHEIKNYITRFEGLYPYLLLIAKKHNLDPFDEKVAEAYWIGNELLDDFDKDDLKELIMLLVKRGLPKSYALKLSENIPENMVPHHSFNVIYVGVGKVTGSVPTNLENINNCLIRPAKIISVKNKSALAQHTPFAYKKNKLVLSQAVEEYFDYLPEFSELKKGDNVSVHWRFIVDKLTVHQLNNLQRYTKNNVSAMAGPFHDSV